MLVQVPDAELGWPLCLTHTHLSLFHNEATNRNIRNIPQWKIAAGLDIRKVLRIGKLVRKTGCVFLIEQYLSMSLDTDNVKQW